MTPEQEARIRQIFQEEIRKAFPYFGKEGFVNLSEKPSSDREIIQCHIQMIDGKNYQFGRTTGTKFGTAADQKLSFYGVTPIVQAGAISAPSGGATIDAQARSAISSLITLLHSVGLSA